MRITLNLNPHQVERLDDLAAARTQSRSELIRLAINDHLARAALEDAFGIWAGSLDGVEYQNRIREEW